MQGDSFPAGVSEQLKWYVYRLIDPRNGETFYVGKGQGNRVFDHASGLLYDDTVEVEEVSDPKLHRIREIQAAGLEVGHIIHRHGIDSARTAYEVEAALIDAFPGLTNKVRGHGSRDFGSRHVQEIIDEYAGVEFEVREPLMLISIGSSYYQLSLYDAVRFAWKVNVHRARTCKLVLANLRGLIVGAFRPTEWLPATAENFRDHPWEHSDPQRHGFVGREAEQDTRDYYVRKRVPPRYRRRGIQSPVLYCDPDSE